MYRIRADRQRLLEANLSVSVSNNVMSNIEIHGLRMLLFRTDRFDSPARNWSYGQSSFVIPA